ncbi:2-hydroxymuconic semialdehyde dehydrogenase [Komagataeibacter sp. FNDCF1]|uniref:2-hydroxymuconic semialdehyde dehydrogenase n=1 Tax=Komagataeibacter sp. FNDCF1 TaxID=2878681 RepID=UPI001E5369B1|nr:2-hydroxymuconic semialdehyde dehydrogenase [Komagataeibacter sp. FNDCF1]MCE2563258.1 2-hydroxymuconic semialdehyde dehydrogenase [Komagataeibacter sp. FNDCF1]
MSGHSPTQMRHLDGLPVLGNFIDGHFEYTDDLFPDISPVDGRVVAHVAQADAAMVDRAVRAARHALEAGAWGRSTVAERVAALRAIAGGIEARFEEFVAAEIADTGKDIHHTRTIDIPRGIANFRFFADLITTMGSESYHTDTADGMGALNYVTRRPVGVVGVIAPWNLPLLLLSWKLAPALACGNAVLAKPSEETPYTATLLAQVMADAGVPPGVFNLLHGFGAGSVGEAITRHPGIDAITFTGESATGTAIMHAAAPGVKPLSFELGGKNGAIVFADADVDEAADGIARSAFSNCGQVCLATERVYVERPLFSRFVQALRLRAEALSPARAAPGSGIGPLISQAHRAKVLGYYDRAVRDGAEVVCGGGVPRFGDARDSGAFVEPTVWTGLPDDAACVREEIFGPVCHVAPFDTEDEVLGRVNDSPYGLAAVVWTNDLRRAHRVAGRIETGIVWVNTWFLRDLRTPFGGIRLSGIGREGGMRSLDFYSETTNICIKL